MSQKQPLEPSEMNAHERDTLCEDNDTTVLEGVNLDSSKNRWVHLSPHIITNLKRNLQQLLPKL